jgi:hypothetical protein
MSRAKQGDGGAAYPYTDNKPQVLLNHADEPLSVINHGLTHPGMTLRDWFAGQVLAGQIVDMCGSHMARRPNDFAEYAYAIADAMLEVRRAKK